jgi:hypothetical protein
MEQMLGADGVYVLRYRLTIMLFLHTVIIASAIASLLGWLLQTASAGIDRQKLWRTPGPGVLRCDV